VLARDWAAWSFSNVWRCDGVLFLGITSPPGLRRTSMRVGRCRITLPWWQNAQQPSWPATTLPGNPQETISETPQNVITFTCGVSLFPVGSDYRSEQPS